MLKEQRIIKINEMLRSLGHVEISELCKTFKVTEMTIRRDLDAITSDNHRVLRIHGGAMLADNDALTEIPYESRISANINLKEKVALKALEYISDGHTVFFDSGTTTQIMAAHLSNSSRIVALTNAINLASELISRPHVSVILIGGELRRNTLSCRGPVSEETIDKFRIDIAFLGLNAIDSNGDLFIASTTESGFKKKIMEVSETKFIVADSTKLDKTSFCKFGNVRDIDGVIVDSSITNEQYENYIGLGATIIKTD